MTKKTWGIVAPLGLSTLTMVFAFLFTSQSPIRWGIVTGITLALLQSFISVGVMTWAIPKGFFYWAWGGGVFFRLIVFAGTAFVVYGYTRLSFVATMLSMVAATTVFLVVESSCFVK